MNFKNIMITLALLSTYPSLFAAGIGQLEQIEQEIAGLEPVLFTITNHSGDDVELAIFDAEEPSQGDASQEGDASQNDPIIPAQSLNDGDELDLDLLEAGQYRLVIYYQHQPFSYYIDAPGEFTINPADINLAPANNAQPGNDENDYHDDNGYIPPMPPAPNTALPTE